MHPRGLTSTNAHIPTLQRTTRACERRASPHRRTANRFRPPASPSSTCTTPRAHSCVPLSELTAMENGSYPNATDALRSSPLAAPQGPGVPV